MNQAVQDRIGKCGIFDVRMSLLDVELAGDDRGGSVVAIIEDFQEIALSLVGQRRDREVIDQEQVCFGE